MYLNGHLFFTRKYKILQLHPKDHSFFYNNTQNFEKLQPNGHSCF